MRPLGDFFESRIYKAGFKSIDDFARATGVSRPAIYRVKNAIAEGDVGNQRGTLEILAEHLQFLEWSELVEAWKDGDLTRNLDTVWVRFARDRYDAILAEAKAVKQEPAEYIWARLQEQKPPQDAGSRGGGSKIERKGRG